LRRNFIIINLGQTNNMAQQTAVEKLKDKINILVDKSNHLSNIYTVKSQLQELFQQAKEMEKQQIEAAWKRGDGEHDEVADKLARQYYTETYTNE